MLFQEKSSKLANDISTLFQNYGYLKTALDDFELWRQNNLNVCDFQNLSVNPSTDDLTTPQLHDNETKEEGSDDLKDWENLKKFVDAKLKNVDAKAKKGAETENTLSVPMSNVAKCKASEKHDDKENKEPKTAAK